MVNSQVIFYICQVVSGEKIKRKRNTEKMVKLSTYLLSDEISRVGTADQAEGSKGENNEGVCENARAHFNTCLSWIWKTNK